jgi:hypothetical protein
LTSTPFFFSTSRRMRIEDTPPTTQQQPRDNNRCRGGSDRRADASGAPSCLPCRHVAAVQCLLHSTSPQVRSGSASCFRDQLSVPCSAPPLARRHGKQPLIISAGNALRLQARGSGLDYKPRCGWGKISSTDFCPRKQYQTPKKLRFQSDENLCIQFRSKRQRKRPGCVSASMAQSPSRRLGASLVALAQPAKRAVASARGGHY